jgi:adenosylmethionine-8-amino-7-oxononanoate aminotransferase
MGLVSARGELVLERGEGVYVFDEQGRRYLDATASLWYCNVGYGRSEIADAVARQIRALPAYHTYTDLTTRPVTELAERIASLFPVEDVSVFFGSGGGGEAVDSAFKLARRYWSLVGESERTVVIARERAYHGMNGFGTALAGAEMWREGVGPLTPDVLHVPWDSAEALGEAIERAGPGRAAAFFCEPVIGAGGVLAPPEGYLDAVRSICRTTGALFVADEVITGFGRAGDWFASGRFALDPDLVTFAKGVTSGYVPLGGVIVSPRVAEPFAQPQGGVTWRHGYTYSGHAAAAAAAHANLDIIERERLVERALALERELADALAPLADHPLVAEVRAGTGVMAAVQLADPALADQAVLAAREAGVLTRVVLGGALQVSPALVITHAELGELADGLSAALDACLERV